MTATAHLSSEPRQPRRPSRSSRLSLVGLALVVAAALGFAACETEFKAPANSTARAQESGTAAEPDAAAPAATFDQQAADTHQKWQDVQNAGSEQEKIDAANAALAAQQQLADSANASPNDGGGQ